jgi:Sap, sulfolipid-1-addressing protein
VQDAVIYALGVAVSPIPIVAVLFVLSRPGALANASAFAAGWVVGLTSCGVIFALLVHGLGLVDSAPRWIATAELAVGVGFLVAAVKLWQNREPSESPRTWSHSDDGFTPVWAAALGAGLSGANPKVLALSLGAAVAVARSGADLLLTGLSVVVFVGIGAVGVVVPVAMYLVAPTRTATGIARARARLVKHEGTVLAVLAVVIGALFVRDGVQSLDS